MCPILAVAASVTGRPRTSWYQPASCSRARERKNTPPMPVMCPRACSSSPTAPAWHVVSRWWETREPWGWRGGRRGGRRPRLGALVEPSGLVEPADRSPARAQRRPERSTGSVTSGVAPVRRPTSVRRARARSASGPPRRPRGSTTSTTLEPPSGDDRTREEGRKVEEPDPDAVGVVEGDDRPSVDEERGAAGRRCPGCQRRRCSPSRSRRGGATAPARLRGWRPRGAAPRLGRRAGCG